MHLFKLFKRWKGCSMSINVQTCDKSTNKIRMFCRKAFVHKQENIFSVICYFSETCLPKLQDYIVF